jgi:ABC-type multidrug transport system fused ATPase/permease subunit
MLAWLQGNIARKKPSEEDAESLGRDYLEKRSVLFRVLFRQHIGLAVLYVVGNGIVLVLGGILVLRKEMSLGQLVAAEIIVSRMLDTLSRFGKYFESFYRISVALVKLHQLGPEQTQREFETYEAVASRTFTAFLHPRWQHMNFRRIFAVAGILLLTFMFLPWQQTAYGEGRVVAFSPTDR